MVIQGAGSARPTSALRRRLRAGAAQFHLRLQDYSHRSFRAARRRLLGSHRPIALCSAVPLPVAHVPGHLGALRLPGGGPSQRAGQQLFRLRPVEPRLFDRSRPGIHPNLA